MNAPFRDHFDFLRKSGRAAAFGEKVGGYPFFTSSQERIQRTDVDDYQGPALVFGTGGSASVHFVDGGFSASNDCYVAVPKSGAREDAQFFYLYLRSNIHLIERGFKGAGLKHVSKGHLGEIEIPTDPRIDRRFVCDVLDKADTIIRKHERLTETTSAFLKSAYVHTVGHLNPRYDSWLPCSVEQLAVDRKGAIRSGPFGSDLRHAEFSDEGIAVLGIDNAVQNKFSWGERRYITEEKYEALRRYRVFPNDVIITIMGTTGRSAVVPNDIPEAITTKHLAAITCDTNKVLPEILSFAIHSDPMIIRQIKSKNKGAIMDGLNLGIIKQLELKQPPMEEQHRFAKIVRNTEAMLDKVDLPDLSGAELFSALSQLAFRGEL